MGLAGRVDTIMRVKVRGETQYHIDHHHLQVVGGGSALHCNWVHRCVVDDAFHLAQP